MLFAVPLYRGEYFNKDLRMLAVKSLMAMIVVLASTTANLVALVALESKELSWVRLSSFLCSLIKLLLTSTPQLCFTTCTLDTFFGAAAIFVVRAPPPLAFQANAHHVLVLTADEARVIHVDHCPREPLVHTNVSTRREASTGSGRRSLDPASIRDETVSTNSCGHSCERPRLHRLEREAVRRRRRRVGLPRCDWSGATRSRIGAVPR